MNENIKWGAAAVAVVGLSIGAVLYLSRSDQAVPPVDAADAPAGPADPAPIEVPEEPAIKHPLPVAEMPDPLPALNESDEPMLAALEGLIGKESVAESIVPRQLVRHVVVTIDNLTNEQVAERLRPVRPAPGTFAVGGPEEAPVLDPANYQRYQPLVRMLQSLDTQRLIAIYTRNYPLFQEAYENLGHPPQYFNDRLIEVIDHLLATPDVQGTIALARPNVLYEFADPQLEARSAGQKALIRMGSDNATAVKEKLRELRSALIARP